MQCQRCQHREATVHLTQVIEGEVNKLHLCADCAQEQGLDLEGPISVTDLLCEFGKEVLPPVPTGEAKPALVCPACGLGRADFKRTGRLGCPDCYSTFSAELTGVVRGLHHAEQHTGKTPRHVQQGGASTEEIETCRLLLAQAVEAEHFGEAARLRDQLRQLLAQHPDAEAV